MRRHAVLAFLALHLHADGRLLAHVHAVERTANRIKARPRHRARNVHRYAVAALDEAGDAERRRAWEAPFLVLAEPVDVDVGHRPHHHVDLLLGLAVEAEPG